MNAGPVDKLINALSSLTDNVVACAVVGGIVVLLLFILWKVLTGRKTSAPPRAANLAIDVTSLGDQGPPTDGPALEFFNQPVRLMAVILAPAGRIADLPPANQWNEVFDAILPGLDKVVAIHKPLIRRWPAQVSARGFAHAFFQQVRLPGDGGKGTPWSSVAGVFKIEGRPVMAGLVLRTESAGSLAQQIIDSEEKWLGCLRVIGG
jgi:hypothetical protein